MRSSTRDAAGASDVGFDVGVLHARERHALTRFAYLLTGDLAAAEDLVHEGVVALACRSRDLDDPDRTLGYVRVCVLDAARRTHRRDVGRRHRHVRLVDRDASPPDDAFVLAEEHRRVARIVRSLPPRQREVVALRYWSGMTEAGIADALGISTGTVKSTASRALHTIADALAQEETS